MTEPDKLEEILNEFHNSFEPLKKRKKKAKAALEAHFREKYLAMLPEKLEELSNPPLHDYEDGQIAGYNGAIDEMREKMERQ